MKERIVTPSLLFFSLFIALVLFRTFYSTPIEFNDESIWKWILGRELTDNREWWNLFESHHELRWTVVVPQIIVAKLWPLRYEGYFITPILTYSLFTLFCVQFLRKNLVNGLPYTILLVAIISFDPMGHVSAGQLNTTSFGLFYAVIGFIFFVRYLGKNKVSQLVISALFLFLAYGAHITYLMFSFAPLAYLLVHKRNYKGALIFVTCLALLIAFESIIFIHITGLSGLGVELEQQSRIGQLLGGAIYSDGTHSVEGGISGQMLFTRWRLIPKYNLGILLFFIIGCGLLLNRAVRGSISPGVWLCLYSVLFYGLAVSFSIIDIPGGGSSFRVVVPLRPRYLAPIFPLASVFIVCLIAYISGRYSSTVQKGLPMILIGAICLVFFAGTINYKCIEEIQNLSKTNNLPLIAEKNYCRAFRYTQEQNIYPSPDAFIFRAQNYYKEFGQDYLNGNVALYGGTRIGVFRLFVRYLYPETNFIKTPNGWYTVDGKDKEYCVMELGQTKEPKGNYRYCYGMQVQRKLFD